MAQTGNPVFDFQAEARLKAARRQKRLLMSGVVLMLVALPLLIFSSGGIRYAVLGAGIFCLSEGLIWGYHWRHRMREEFKTKYSIATSSAEKSTKTTEN